MPQPRRLSTGKRGALKSAPRKENKGANRYERTVDPPELVPEEIDEEELLENMCPDRWQILMAANETLGELCDALRAREAVRTMPDYPEDGGIGPADALEKRLGTR